MKKFKKIISMGLTAIMALSIMCVSVSAAVTDKNSVPAYSVEYVGDSKIVTIELAPGEYIATSDFSLANADEDKIWGLQTSIGTTITRTFNCNASDGNSLNVWVRNNGTSNVRATFTMPSNSSVMNVEPGEGGYTFNTSNATGISGAHTVRIVDVRGSGYDVNVSTKARQFWN